VIIKSCYYSVLSVGSVVDIVFSRQVPRSVRSVCAILKTTNLRGAYFMCDTSSQDLIGRWRCACHQSQCVNTYCSATGLGSSPF